MKQIAVISGKGGTGKTFITASLAVLSHNKVLVDCDVDAADLHLLLHPTVMEKYEFIGLPKVAVHADKCNRCGECLKVCRFNAIRLSDTDVEVDGLSCEGCEVCTHICPTGALYMEEHVAGEWYVSKTDYGPLVHARLGIAEENSGKLVSVVKQRAREIAQQNNLDYIIIDGPPGTGCPVIASLSGVTIALVVTEPTLSGIHDMERIVGVARHFGVKTSCVVNKFDINMENTQRIEQWTKEQKIPLYGSIPYDRAVLESVIHGVPIVEYAHNAVTEAIKNIWTKVGSHLNRLT